MKKTRCLFDMKRCFKCKRRKERRMFYAHPEMGDGLLGKCKSCTKKDVQANYRKRIGHYRAYDKSRYKRPDRKVAVGGYQRQIRKRNPGKYRARMAVSNAIRAGRLVRQSCQECGAKAQAHHTDYRRPLFVKWLCFKHHRAVHGQEASA